MFIGSHINAERLSKRANQSSTERREKEEQEKKAKAAQEQQAKEGQKKQQEKKAKAEQESQAKESKKKKTHEQRRKQTTRPRHTPQELDPQEKRHLNALLQHIIRHAQATQGELKKAVAKRDAQNKAWLPLFKRANALAQEVARFRRALGEQAFRS